MLLVVGFGAWSGDAAAICRVDGGVTEPPEIVAGFFMTRWLTLQSLELTKRNCGVTALLNLYCELYCFVSFACSRYLRSGDGSVVERRTCDRKVSSSTPGRSGGRIFLSMVNFLC